MKRTLISLITLLLAATTLWSQEVTVQVQPIQQVLPPQVGQYVDNPGKFFIVRLTNNTDEQQMLHIGLQMEKRFPEDVLMVQTRYGHIPRVPITLAPNQVKTLNPVEMKQLFTHYTLEDVYVKDGTYQDYKNGIFGLLPEGQYELFLTAYKWDPYLVSPVTLSDPKAGNTLFNVCYKAQSPRFLTPIQNVVPDDPLSMYAVTKVDRKNAMFTWAPPTMNCNASMVSFQYNVRIVRLEGLSPDEAIEKNPVVYERNRLITPQLSIPEAYIRQMLADKALSDVFALQVTATTTGQNANSLNYTMLENDGKSAVYLFRLQDLVKAQQKEEDVKEKPAEQLGDGYALSLDDEDSKAETDDSLYVFEQPMLTQPSFSNDRMGRKIYFGEDIKPEWRKAWFAGGKGEEQDTVKFEYTVQLFTGNSADTPQGIFAGKPIYEKKTKELKDTIKWDKFKEKVAQGEYMMLRVTAKSTNEKSIRMLPDSLNYIDFALTQHFEDDFACGTSTADVKNKELITKLPEKGTNLKINSWYLTLNDDCKLDKDEHTVSGTGWIAWKPMGSGNIMNCRIAVKFTDLKVNTDNEVFEGKCQTYAKSSAKKNGYTAEQVVDSLFSQTGLDNIWGNLSLPADVKEKVSKKAKDEVYDVAKAYKLGQYYGYLKQVQNKWGNIKQGNLIDLYFPVELPDEISKLMPKDFSVQIASMTFSPKSAVMNLIGMIAMPNSNVIKNNDVLVFGCPRLCISPDRILPEDGVLALLSNFKIQDPGSDFSLTFVAPSDALNPAPNDGCFIRWENGDFGGLGLEIAATMPNTKRVVDGKVQKDLPALLDLRTVIRGNESAGDFIAYGSLTPFQVNDLPDWTFTIGEQIIFDHNLSENGTGMPSLSDVKSWAGDTYDPKQCGSYVATDWDAWQGVYVKNVSVQFPKFAVFGSGDKGVTVGAENMIIDGSGLTCKFFTKNLLDAQTGKCGGWKFTIDEATVQIVQNNFDKCEIKGGFGIPLFGKKSNDTGNANNNQQQKKGEETDVNYTCQIRHLTDPKTETYYTYDKDGKKIAHTRHTYGEKNRYAYIFRTDQVNDLYMNCFVADLSVIADQTYFVVAAEEQDDGKTKTDVELRMAGDLTIANQNSVNAALAKISKNLPMKVSMPGIHFAKLRLSNFKYADRNKSLVYKYAKDKVDDADNAEADWKKTHTTLVTLAKSKELELSAGSCYLDLGEWSLASVKKKLGPFSFELSSYKFKYEQKKLMLDVEGKVGLCGDKVTAGAGLSISSDLTIPSDKTDISSYKLSNGKIEFNSITLNCDFANVLKLDGRLNVVKDSTDAQGNKVNGYSGKINVEIKGLFGVDCQGGYFSVKATDKATKDQVKADAKEEGIAEYATDNTYSYGYFMLEIKSKAGIHLDPLVINRIAGGFYFNCRPKWNNSTKSFEKPIAAYGCIGVSLGMGFSTSAGEDVLNANVDLNVVYMKTASGGKLTTFLFKGDVNAVSGMIDANMTLLYQNDDQERFLSLDITVTAGLENGKLGQWMKTANAELEKMQTEINKFQESIDSKVKNFVPSANGNLKSALDDNDKHKKSTDSKNTGDIDANAKKKAEDSEKSRGVTVNLPFQLKITWKEKGVTKSPVRWHLYLGEPEKSKRCKIQLIDFKSSIVNVNIGADAYLCIGNELPGNGQLPAIPSEITNFISPGGVDTGADMQKAQRSRQAAMQAMLPTGGNVKGGVMVGASAWGFIDIDLGLFYGGLKAIAGFDMALVKYDPAGYCINLKRAMGKNGWYAQGQFYAYLAAKFGLHIKLGKLIDKKIDIVDAGIGGVFQAGLPSPTWVDGRARVKLRLLAGLVNINKSFHFECGDYCESFMGNALDGFNLFGNLSIGSDSCRIGWDANNAIMVAEGKRAMLTTEAALNSQYRLIDPSTQNQLVQNNGLDPSQAKLNAARTYIFDFNTDANKVGTKMCKKGARLYEFDANAYEWLLSNGYVGQTKKVARAGRPTRSYYDPGTFDSDWSGSYESNIQMKDHRLSSTKVKDDSKNQEFEKLLNSLVSYEVPVTVRESRGTRFHLDMTLKSNRYYLLVLTGTGFEVEDGCCYWPTITEEVSKGKFETRYYNWIQHKFFYFRTESAKEIPSMITDLQPYVALAYPASDDGKLINTINDGSVAYDGDLASPTIALNQDISQKAFKDGQLFWQLKSRKSGNTNFYSSQERDNIFTASTFSDGGKGINMGPKSSFTVSVISGTEKNQMEYNLRLGYRYKTSMACSNGLEENATNEERWAVYNRFIISNGYSNTFENYRKGKGYNQSYYSIVGTKTNAQCYTLYVLAKQWINSDSKVKDKWDRWLKSGIDDLVCAKDTVLYLSDLWFKGTDHKSWRERKYKETTTSSNANGLLVAILMALGQAANLANNQLLPYERPFVGVRPALPLAYSYSNYYDDSGSNTPKQTFDYNESIYQNTSTKGFRLKDPYLYFAYLSNYVFVGGRKIKAYSFDDVPVPHASETLTFSYNGIDVQGSAQIQGLTKTMFEVRNSMYQAWNNWNYGNASYAGNDSYQPVYPLPTGLGPLYDVTIANQDGKASTMLAYRAGTNDKYPYHLGLGEYLKDFTAPYFLAYGLSKKLKEVADELYNLYLDMIKKKNKGYQSAIAKYDNMVKYYTDKTKTGTQKQKNTYKAVLSNFKIAHKLWHDLDKAYYYHYDCEKSPGKITYNGKEYMVHLPMCKNKKHKGQSHKDYEKLEEEFDNAVKAWSNKHRGQYLTAEYRGFQVRVPYYQLPFIFGDCFGLKTEDDSKRMDKANGFFVSNNNRSFSASIGSSNKLNDRWESETSNLLFFRLTSSGHPFCTWEKNELSNDYTGGPHINCDMFYPESGSISCIKSMSTKIYRVNAFNMDNGQFYYSDKVNSAVSSSYSDFFSEMTVDPLKDASAPSAIKGNMYQYFIDALGGFNSFENQVVIDGGGIENDINAGKDVKK